MFRYYELLTDMRPQEVLQLKADVASGVKHPREVKVNLAKFLVARFHSQAAAQSAVDEFNRIFVDKGLPDQIEESDFDPQEIGIVQMLTKVAFATSNSEATRLIQGGGVSINQEKVSDAKLKLSLKSGDELILKAGKKKFIKIKVK